MRKTLLEKCDMLIKSKEWPHRGQDLRTDRVFKDLLQFYESEACLMTDTSANDIASLSSNKLLMPEIGKQMLAQDSIESLEHFKISTGSDK